MSRHRKAKSKRPRGRLSGASQSDTADRAPAPAPSRLQQELRKRSPFELPEEETYLNLRRTLEPFAFQFEKLFESHGLSDAQYNVLRILRGVGADGLPCREIADRMVTRDPDVTRLADRLEQAGLLERFRVAQDRRVVRLRATPAGLAAVDRLDAPVAAMHRRLLGHLSRAELGQLIGLLEKARKSASPPCS